MKPLKCRNKKKWDETEHNETENNSANTPQTNKEKSKTNWKIEGKNMPVYISKRFIPTSSWSSSSSKPSSACFGGGFGLVATIKESEKWRMPLVISRVRRVRKENPRQPQLRNQSYHARKKHDKREIEYLKRTSFFMA